MIQPLCRKSVQPAAKRAIGADHHEKARDNRDVVVIFV